MYLQSTVLDTEKDTPGPRSFVVREHCPCQNSWFDARLWLLSLDCSPATGGADASNKGLPARTAANPKPWPCPDPALSTAGTAETHEHLGVLSPTLLQLLSHFYKESINETSTSLLEKFHTH